MRRQPTGVEAGSRLSPAHGEGNFAGTIRGTTRLEWLSREEKASGYFPVQYRSRAEMKAVSKPISTFDAIEHFLSDKSAGDMIWLSDAIRAVRAVQPACELEDGELGEVIARHAILHKCNISFDSPPGRGN
jgi:hypothetical protein